MSHGLWASQLGGFDARLSWQVKRLVVSMVSTLHEGVTSAWLSWPTGGIREQSSK